MSTNREVFVTIVCAGVSPMDGTSRFEVIERDMSRPSGMRDRVLGTFGPKQRDHAHDFAKLARAHDERCRYCGGVCVSTKCTACLAGQAVWFQHG